MDGSQWEQIERAQLKMDRRHFSRIALGFLIYNLVGVGLQLVGIQFLSDHLELDIELYLHVPAGSACGGSLF